MKHYLNVCDVNGGEIAPVDIITFGSPCQDLSVAGKRVGLKHDELGDAETTRSGLFVEAVRIIKEMREKTDGKSPTFAFWENVPGAFSSQKGEDFRVVLEELAKIKASGATIPRPPKGKWTDAGAIMGDGWSLAWRILDAQFHGVPQRRRRILLVADFAGGRAAEILFECSGLPGYPAESGAAGQGAAGDVAGGPVANDRAGGVTAFHLTQDPISSEEVSPCLSSGNPKNGQATVGICAAFSAGQGAKAGGIGWQEECAPTLKGVMSGGNTVPTACIPINDKATRYRGGGNSRDGDGCGNGLGIGKPGDPSPTLTVGDHHAVCIDCRNMVGSAELSATLQAKGDGGFSLNYINPVVCYDARGNGDGAIVPTITGDHEGRITDYTAVAVEYLRNVIRYIVRRLTPTECARLQGFPDWWSELPTITDMSDEDYAFWCDVLKTKAVIEDKPYKAKTRPQMVAWYNKLHTDGAEYKMWGNGVALPVVRVPLHEMAKLGARTLGSLFDGSGGFPLAGALDGITPLWASEIEPYPIAVTRARFREVTP